MWAMIVKEFRQVRRDRRTQDRKSTRLNSSHSQISYAVFCLKKKKEQPHGPTAPYNATYSQACIRARPGVLFLLILTPVLIRIQLERSLINQASSSVAIARR